MSAEEWKYPEWQDPLQELILEFDHEKAREKGKKWRASFSRGFRNFARRATVAASALTDALSVLRIAVEHDFATSAISNTPSQSE
jgi:predicted secreted protein